MGVDVQIGIEGVEWLPEHPLAERVQELLGDPGWNGLVTQHDGWLEISSMERYYGPGYERGSWPRIYGGLRALAAMYPDARITYGGDGVEVWECPDATPEALEQIWSHWLGENGDAYRRRWRQ